MELRVVPNWVAAHLFIQLYKCLLSTYYIPGSVLSPGNKRGVDTVGMY